MGCAIGRKELVASYSPDLTMNGAIKIISRHISGQNPDLSEQKRADTMGFVWGPWTVDTFVSDEGISGPSLVAVDSSNNVLIVRKGYYRYRDIKSVEIVGDAPLWCLLTCGLWSPGYMRAQIVRLTMQDKREVNIANSGPGLQGCLFFLPFWILDPGCPVRTARELAGAFEFMRLHSSSE